MTLAVNLLNALPMVVGGIVLYVCWYIEERYFSRPRRPGYIPIQRPRLGIDKAEHYDGRKR